MSDELNKTACVIRERPKTVSECAEIAHAEFMYWQQQEPSEHSVSGLAAAANIFAAISMGIMAPWHPNGEKKS